MRGPSIPLAVSSNKIDTESRFAFVEYEDRRDADDAYHEMHNKRIGRDDMLKIEASPGGTEGFYANRLTLDAVGSYSSICFLAF